MDSFASIALNEELPAGQWRFPPLTKTRERRTALFWQGGFDSETGEIVALHGIVGGKIQVSRRAIETNTSGRVLVDQAALALRHKYHIKIDSEGFFYEKQFSLVNAEGEAEEAEAESGGAAFPMLAVSASIEELAAGKHAASYPVFAQGKYDGVRCMGSLSGGVVSLHSRKRSDFAHLVPIFAEEVGAVLSHLPPGAVLDGELYVEPPPGSKADFQLITSLVRTCKRGASDEARERLVYCVFGAIIAGAPSANYLERRALVETAFAESLITLHKTTHDKMRLVSHVACALFADLAAAHEINTKVLGFEGTVAYPASGIYKCGARALIKIKNFFEVEGLIVAVKAGKGRESDQALFDVRVDCGKIVTMRPAGTADVRRKWLEEPASVVGKPLTYTFQELTKDGLPRFPVARAIRDYE